MARHRHHHHAHGHTRAHGDGHVHVETHATVESSLQSGTAETSEAVSEDVGLLEAAFVEGFRGASDKASFLRLAGIPHELPGKDGNGLKLVEVRIADRFEVGAATPGFGTAELVYHPFPGAMVRTTTQLCFVYCALRETKELRWSEVMSWETGVR